MKRVMSIAAYKKRSAKLADRSDAGQIVMHYNAIDPVDRRMQELGIDLLGRFFPVKGDEFSKWAEYITRGDLKRFRAEHLLSRADVARILGVSPAKVARWTARDKSDDDFLPIKREDFKRLEKAYPDHRDKGGYWRALMKKNGLL